MQVGGKQSVGEGQWRVQAVREVVGYGGPGASTNRCHLGKRLAFPVRGAPRGGNPGPLPNFCIIRVPARLEAQSGEARGSGQISKMRADFGFALFWLSGKMLLCFCRTVFFLPDVGAASFSRALFFYLQCAICFRTSWFLLALFLVRISCKLILLIWISLVNWAVGLGAWGREGMKLPNKTLTLMPQRGSQKHMARERPQAGERTANEGRNARGQARFRAVALGRPTRERGQMARAMPPTGPGPAKHVSW